MFLQNLSILKNEKKNASLIICFLDYESGQRIKPFFWKRMFIECTFTINYDSIHIFTKKQKFVEFTKNKNNRLIWSSNKLICSYNNKTITDYYKKSNNIYQLSIPNDIKAETYKFYENYVYPSLPIIVNIRNNMHRNIERNSNIDELLKFFKLFETSSKYKFIIICNKEEIPKKLRNLKNIIFSKDYFNNIIEDLSLINTGYLGIFPGSGMNVMAQFSNLPFIIFGHLDSNVNNSFIANNKVNKFAYMNKYQSVYDSNIDHIKLYKLFNNLIKKLIEEDFNNNKEKKNYNLKKIYSKF
jgi:hypothetical protein